MHAVIAHVDYVGPGCLSTGRRPAAVADNDVALPGAAIIVAETDQRVAIKSGIFDCQHAPTDGVRPHMAQITATDRVAS